jgi:F0F1-type ATP synthase assembly protein I
MSNPSPWRHVFAGSVLAITIVIGVLGGRWVDWVDVKFGMDPWGTLAGALLGIGAGFYNLWKEFMDEPNR